MTGIVAQHGASNCLVIWDSRQEAVLTHREFEFLQFLLDHPHRFYTASQITGFAWSDAALPEEVRNYVLRLRKILRLQIPCDLVNRPGRGYSLTLQRRLRPSRGQSL